MAWIKAFDRELHWTPRRNWLTLRRMGKTVNMLLIGPLTVIWPKSAEETRKTSE